jgi:Fe-S cluster biosynthesis and repair protein YggX
MSNQPPVPKPAAGGEKPAGAPSPDASPRLVLCAKLGRELPGLAAPPFATELGQKIYDAVSREAWTLWLQHSLMLVNEKGLRLGDPAAREVWMRECEAFLFGSGSAPPPGWVPPAGFVRLSTKKD